MKKSDCTSRRTKLNLRVFLILTVFAAVGIHIADLQAESGRSPADVGIEKVADLGIIETAPVILGRDGGYSVPFQNRSIWIYGDTVIKPNHDSDPVLLSNSCSWTTDRNAADGISGFTPCLDALGIPREVFPFTDQEREFNRNHGPVNCRSEPCGVRWALWPGSAINDRANSRLLLFFKKLLVKPGILNFETRGHAMAIWGKFDKPPERIPNYPGNKCSELMFNETEPAFGSAAVVAQSMVYVFGCSLEGFSKPCRLARVPLAHITDRHAWEFYGVSGQWQKDIGKCRAVLDGNDMMSVSYNDYAGRYIAVYSQPMSTGVMLRTSKKIEGPWSDPLKAFEAMRPANGIDWIYDAMEHPEYARENGRVLYITYSRQTGALTFEMRLVAVTLQ